MRILTTYIAREFLKLFLMCLSAFVAIYFIVDFFEKVDNFHEARLPLSTMMQFFMLNVPLVVSQVMPVAVLMSTILTLGLMARRNELIALKAGGISMIRVCVPILLLSACLTVGTGIINEAVLPATARHANYIWEVLVEKKPRRFFKNQRIWFKDHRSIYNIKYVDAQNGQMFGVSIYQFDKEFNLTRRIDAKKAVYVRGKKKWFFFQGVLLERRPDGAYSHRPFDKRIIELKQKPADFQFVQKPSEEMTFAELKQYIGKISAEGHDPIKYRVDLNAKVSFPFVCIVLTLIGIPLVTRKERGGNLGVAVVWGIFSVSMYLTFFGSAKALFGYHGILPPIWAAWLTNIVFTLTGLFMMTHVKK